MLQIRENKLVFSGLDQKNNFSNTNFLTNININGDIAILNLGHPIYNSIMSENIEKPWLITRHTFSKNNIGFKLHENDYLKLGKIIFKVKEIKIKKEKICQSQELKDRTSIDHIPKDNFNIDNGNNDNSDNLRALHLNSNFLNITNNTNLRMHQSNDFLIKPAINISNFNNENVEKLILKENRNKM